MLDILSGYRYWIGIWCRCLVYLVIKLTSVTSQNQAGACIGKVISLLEGLEQIFSSKDKHDQTQVHDITRYKKKTLLEVRSCSNDSSCIMNSWRKQEIKILPYPSRLLTWYLSCKEHRTNCRTNEAQRGPSIRAMPVCAIGIGTRCRRSYTTGIYSAYCGGGRAWMVRIGSNARCRRI